MVKYENQSLPWKCENYQAHHGALQQQAFNICIVKKLTQDVISSGEPCSGAIVQDSASFDNGTDDGEHSTPSSNATSLSTTTPFATLLI
ncbi:hypothetical protein PanWU01x14_132990 [Parasponia andersonii]|uniref:Uncharacterized protein n=1 Tax=Parasponia andersonii TaxID=3476 RepID=A0A2P5CQA1_PARAD|nr:hypothetical protein PanWU01x14_132990 [Parasponia andersonii]